MGKATTTDEDQGRDRLPPDREREVSVWARAHGVSADELAGRLENGQPATPEQKARERPDAEAEAGQAVDKD